MSESWLYETLRSRPALSTVSSVLESPRSMVMMEPSFMSNTTSSKKDTKSLRNAVMAIGVVGLCLSFTLATLFGLANTLIWPLPIGDRLPWLPLRPPSFITAPYFYLVPPQLVYGAKVVVVGLGLLLQVLFNAILSHL